LRLKLALHLAPPGAINYSPSNPTPRWRLIQSHLIEHLGRSGEETLSLAREVAATLKSWQENRQSVSSYLQPLLERDGDRCKACHIAFDIGSATSLVSSDPYKPYFVKDRTRGMNGPTVDHVVPVSGFGSNEMGNLQLLCELCNQGKGALEPPLLKHEFKYAGDPIEAIPWSHRAKLLYFALEAGRFACAHCHNSSSELTVRRIVAEGAIVSTNLHGTCYACLGDSAK
jgi:hypothetical protein